MPTKSEIIEKLARAMQPTMNPRVDITFCNGTTKAQPMSAFEYEQTYAIPAAEAAFNALSEYVTFLEEGSEPEVGDIIELPHDKIGILDDIEDQNDTGDNFYYDPLYILKGETWGNRCFNRIIQRKGKPVITLQKE